MEISSQKKDKQDGIASVFVVLYLLVLKTTVKRNVQSFGFKNHMKII